MNDITIENIIASFTLDQSLDLHSIAEKIPEATFNQQDAQLLTVQWQQPRIACLINADGKTILTGAHSLEELTDGIKQLQTMMKTIDVPLKKVIKPNIDKVVASTQLGISLNLEQIQNKLTDGIVEYKPEQSPWIQYTPNHPNTVILVFNSGTIVACSPSIEMASQLLQQVSDLLLKIRENE